jgi:hypothetical protein
MTTIGNMLFFLIRIAGISKSPYLQPEASEVFPILAVLHEGSRTKGHGLLSPIQTLIPAGMRNVGRDHAYPLTKGLFAGKFLPDPPSRYHQF